MKKQQKVKFASIQKAKKKLQQESCVSKLKQQQNNISNEGDFQNQELKSIICLKHTLPVQYVCFQCEDDNYLCRNCLLVHNNAEPERKKKHQICTLERSVFNIQTQFMEFKMKLEAKNQILALYHDQFKEKLQDMYQSAIKYKHTVENYINSIILKMEQKKQQLLLDIDKFVTHKLNHINSEMEQIREKRSFHQKLRSNLEKLYPKNSNKQINKNIEQAFNKNVDKSLSKNEDSSFNNKQEESVDNEKDVYKILNYYFSKKDLLDESIDEKDIKIYRKHLFSNNKIDYQVINLNSLTEIQKGIEQITLVIDDSLKKNYRSNQNSKEKKSKVLNRTNDSKLYLTKDKSIESVNHSSYKKERKQSISQFTLKFKEQKSKLKKSLQKNHQNEQSMKNSKLIKATSMPSSPNKQRKTVKLYMPILQSSKSGLFKKKR